MKGKINFISDQEHWEKLDYNFVTLKDCDLEEEQQYVCLYSFYVISETLLDVWIRDSHILTYRPQGSS